VFAISNPTEVAATVFEPHPHTSVELFDANGQRWPMHYGVFAATPRWQVTVPPGEVRRRIITLPRFFLDAQGAFGVVCKVPCRVGDNTERLTVRGSVWLALPTTAEYYAEAEAAARLRVEQYERSQFVYPLPDAAERGCDLGSSRHDSSEGGPAGEWGHSAADINRCP
jgi:hypothetical protein